MSRLQVIVDDKLLTVIDTYATAHGISRSAAARYLLMVGADSLATRGTIPEARFQPPRDTHSQESET